MKYTKMQKFWIVLFSLSLILILLCGAIDASVPDSVFLSTDDNLPSFLFHGVTLEEDESALPVFAGGKTELTALCTNSNATASLFGVIPVKTVQIHQISERQVIPGGSLFGVKLYTEGVLVIGIHDLNTAKGTQNPAKDAGIHVRDMITKINGNSITSGDVFSKAVNDTNGEKMTLTVKRGSSELDITLRAVLTEDGSYKTGIYVRDNTAGIGTVTFIDPQTGIFCGLGHGICDADTGVLLPLSRGTLMGVTLSGVHPSTNGSPGELCGYFTSSKTGSLLGNTETGVFGLFTGSQNETLKTVSIGLHDEVHTGQAQIISTVSLDGIPTTYNIEILKISNGSAENKNFVIQVTDQKLLDITGGIVQGMSGSPILQDGKLIGAVTHVMVNDPTKGYGIFLENMLTSVPEILE